MLYLKEKSQYDQEIHYLQTFSIKKKVLTHLTDDTLLFLNISIRKEKGQTRMRAVAS